MGAAKPQSLAATLKEHERLTVNGDEETISFLPDSQEDAGPICTKLLMQLKGIQLGKVEDKFGWCFKVSAEDGQKVIGESVQNGTSVTPDQLD